MCVGPSMARQRIHIKLQMTRLMEIEMIYPLANIVPPKDDDIFVSDNLKMDQMLWGAEAEICSEGGHRKFEALLEAQEKLLYP